MPKAKQSFSIEIQLSDHQVRALSDQLSLPLTDGQKVANLALGALEDLANGGMVLQGHIAKQILAATGQLSDFQDLVKIVEAGCNREDGTVLAKWKPDPTYVPVLQEAADSNGVTIQQATQNLMDWGVSQGWGYAVNPEVSVLFINKADMQFLREAFGKDHVTGTELVDFLRGVAATPYEPVQHQAV